MRRRRVVEDEVVRPARSTIRAAKVMSIGVLRDSLTAATSEVITSPTWAVVLAIAPGCLSTSEQSVSLNRNGGLL